MGARELSINTVLFRNVVGNKLGVNVTDMECLSVLFFKRLATPTELAEYTGLSSGATTAMLDRLEKVELIERHPNPIDRRGLLISISKKSAKKIGPIFNGIRDSQSELATLYTEKELLLIGGFLERLSTVWEEERQSMLEKA
jgi:DNA-binding MarR family transcriptional regulator